MKILFFAHTRLGDAVLSTGVVRHFVETYPDARLTVVCSPLVAGIFSALPSVEKVISIRKRKYAGHWRDVWRVVVKTRWDVVVDLRNSAVSRLIWARRRLIWRPQPETRHKVEQVADILGVSPPPAPFLRFDAAASARANAFFGGLPSGPYLAVAPVANWIGKTWPAESFKQLIARIAAGEAGDFLSAAQFVIMAGPGEERVAEDVLSSCPPGRGHGAIAVLAPLEAAAVISRCDAFVGNDSGLMHCAAATGVPTLGLFGPSNRAVYRPWGEESRIVTTPESFEEIQRRPGYSPSQQETLMGSLTVEAVLAALRDLPISPK